MLRGIAVGLLVGALLVPSASAAPAGWTIAASPSPGADPQLRSVATVPGSQEAWAVGQSDLPDGSAIAPLVEHRDPVGWVVVDTPSFNGNTELFGVAAIAAGDVWAVGRRPVPNGDATSLAEHWDGAEWNVVPTPSASDRDLLLGVSARAQDDVWAVGVSGGRGPTLVERWDGSQWLIVPSKNPGSSGNAFLAVATVPHSRVVWAIGYYSDGAGLRPMGDRWNGKAWRVFPMPYPASSADVYLDGAAAISGRDVWAVGYSVDAVGKLTALAEHW